MTLASLGGWNTLLAGEERVWLYFYTPITNYEKENLRKQFTVTSIGSQDLGINLTEDVKGPYLKNHKTLKI